ncbi:MAG: AAA family ATPase [Candidatus Omnitrophica bacterium CG11_big_fil_rev_8_21_14_0_20_64_10]|nr:MAG: AAA family ATPase [Candidatus Omnitrophica bacterium CG11_big_fil_rev_8_21_14_0_20_64_10]
MASRRPSPTAGGDLFGSNQSNAPDAHAPLAARMRPRALEEFIGQSHLLGPGKLLRRAIESDRLTSVILYGPPGCGKTALGFLLAARTQAHVERLNAVAAGVEELRRVIQGARARRQTSGGRTLLFLDEIHRFNKAQQDVLMPEVEDGTLILVGATTHNPFFSIVSPLLSRSLVAEFRPLLEEDLKVLLHRAIADPERGLGKMKLAVAPEAVEFLAKISDGDARRALNALELAAITTPADPKTGEVRIGTAEAQESVQKKMIRYDADDDAHYDTISAYIKSLRGSDPDAALYWLAKMLTAGEDPRFIARRLVICAAEDVGLADPQALLVATAAAQAVEFVGMPECRIPLAEGTVYVATAPKSNAAYLGIEQATRDVEQGKALEVPDHLRGSNYPGAQRLGHGKGYKYAHDFPGHRVEQAYLPESRRYYDPSDQGFERQLRERLKRRKPD